MREGKLDSIQSDNIRMLDPYEALDVFLDELELLTALVGSVIVRVKCDQMDLERKRRRNVIANRFGLIHGSEIICGSC
jgi:hypothetical protein